MPAKTARSAASRAKKATPPPSELLTLRYSLAELPSAQHRAGLAGLVLLTQEWMPRQKRKGAYAPVRVDEHGAELQFDLTGLRSLMDEVYDATTEEQPQGQIRKDRNGQPVKPLREVEVEETGKDGKVKRKKQYVYPVTVPRAAYLKDRDPSDKGVWVKLWRDMVWTTLRGVPKTRAPFEARAEGRETSDAEEAWEQLRSSSDAPTDLKSTYFLGAMESTADNVPFKDRARFQFLLHFWPYVAQVYVLQTIEVDERGHPRDKLTNEFVVAVPDVALLSSFCGDYHGMLKDERSAKVLLYRPRDAVIDLPGEGALDFSWRLRIAKREGRRRTADLVLGFDVFHVYKDGNNVRLASTARISPTAEQTDRFQTLRQEYQDPRFRRLRLANLLAERPPLHGLNALFQTVPYEQTVGSHSFRADARHFLKLSHTSESPMSQESDEAQSLEKLVYELVSQYVWRKTEAKAGYDWKTASADERKKRDYNDAKANVAKGAFLAVRSRTADEDFVSYFAGTLCSVPHHLGPEKFKVLARALQEQPGEVRTLTLLALSANG